MPSAMNALTPLVLALAVAGLSSCASSTPRTGWTAIGAWGYSFSVPTRVAVTLRSPVEDFQLAEVRDDKGSILLRIYSGNHPGFNKHGRPEDSTRMENLLGVARSTHWRDEAGRLGGEILISTNGCESCPQFLHLEFDGLTQEQVDFAERIWSTIRL